MVELEYDVWDVGREDYSRGLDKIRRAVTGDKTAVFDVKDSFRRFKLFRSYDNRARRSFVNMVLALSLSFYGFVFAVLSLSATSGEANMILNAPSRLADLLIFDLVLISAVVFILVLSESFRTGILSRFIDSEKPNESNRYVEMLNSVARTSKKALIYFQIVPVIIMVVIFVSVFIKPDIVTSAKDLYFNIGGSLPPTFYDLFRGYVQNSPLGFTVRELGPVLIMCGAVLSIPYVSRTGKVYFNALSAEPAEITDPEEEDEIDVEEDIGYDYEPTVGTIDTSGWDAGEILSVPDSMRDSPIRGFKEIKRYWARPPFSYVKILSNERSNKKRYFVEEPELTTRNEEMYFDELESRLKIQLINEDQRSFESMDKDQQVDLLVNKTKEVINEYDLTFDKQELGKLLYFIKRNYVHYDKIDPLMSDGKVEDISCNGHDSNIYLYHEDYHDIRTNISFEKEELRRMIIRMAQKSGKHISRANPSIDATLPDGSRIQMTLGGEVTTRGSSFTIRKFEEIPFTPVDLLRTDTFTKEQLGYLWMMIEEGRSMIVVGGTASGKTTTMNAVSLFIPPESKVVSIEDTRELNLPHENWLPSKTRDSLSGDESQEINMYELLRNALRQRPEYIVVGEIRGEEAKTLFQGMSTGHVAYCTMHAENIEEAKERLTSDPINVPDQMLQALDLMCIQLHRKLGGKTVRRNKALHEVDVETGMDESPMRKNTIFDYDKKEDSWKNDLEKSVEIQRMVQETEMSEQEVMEEIQRRGRVLQYMVDHDIVDPAAVVKVIQAYMLTKDRVMKDISMGTLDPGELEGITQEDFYEVDDIVEEDLMDEGEPMMETGEYGDTVEYPENYKDKEEDPEFMDFVEDKKREMEGREGD